MCATPARHRAARKDSACPEQDFWAARHLLGGASTKHARRVAPKYGLPIGRVGALAVSLGVGFAIAHSSGIAYADTESSATSSGPKSDNDTGAGPGGADTSTRTSSDDADSTDGRDAQTSSRGEQSDTDHTGTAGHDDTGAADEAGDPDTGSPADTSEPSEESVTKSDAESSESTDGSVTDAPVSEPPVVETPSTESDDGGHPDVSPSVQTAPSGAPDRATSVGDAAASGPEPDAASEGVSAPTDDDPAEPDLTASARGTQDEDPGLSNAHPVLMTLTPARAAAVPMASATPAGENTETVNVMTALVSGVVSPFVDPHAPATAPWFDALLAWVRRQIVHTFFNESPVYGPIDSHQIVTGQVLVDLHAYDPNGDPLKYTIVQPAHGLVFRDPVTGQFVYTPTSVVTGTPLQDSFKVVISDGTEHLRGPIGRVEAIFHALARLIGIAERDDVTVTVPVTVTPIVQLPPVVVTTGAATYIVGSNPVKVLSTAVITDPDSPKLSSAAVTLTNGQSGDVLGYTAPLGNPVTAQWDAATKTLRLSGSATLAQYEAALKAVSFSTTQGGVPRIASISVKDESGVQSLVSGLASIVVLAIPPLLVVAPLAIGTAGSAVRVSPIVSITDLDSQTMSSATVAVKDATVGDVLGYGSLPSGITATVGSGSVTFTGLASVAAYQQVLQSVTLTSPNVGIKTVTFTLTDDQGETSIPVSTAVTFVGLPVAAPPLIVTAPVAVGTTGSPVTVSPVVVITDIDSTQLSSATVSASGGSLSYGTLPSGVTATAGAGSVTFTGAASVAAYQQLLQSVTLTSSQVGINSVAFTVTDNQGGSSVPAVTVVTAVGLPAAIAPLVVVTPVAAGMSGSAVTVSPVVVITDIDSTQLASATVSTSGGSLNYGTLPSGVTATPGAGSVTFTGAASVAAYQQLLQSVTLTSSSAAIETVTFTVTDDQGQSSLPVATAVTVLGLPVAVPPLVVVAPVAAGTSGSAVTVSPVVVITDIDSTQLSSATVSASGGSLSYGTLPSGVTTTPGAGSVTFTGAASVAAYQQLLQSVTLTSPSAGIVTVSFTVTDDQGQSSLPVATAVTVLGLPVAAAPLVVTAPVAAGTAGSAATVSPVVLITDIDSTQLASATVTTSGGSLSYGALPSGVTATASSGSVTFTGAASVAAYQQLLQSVTLTSASSTIATVSFTVTDDQGQASVPATTIVTVVGLPVAAAPLVVAVPVAAGTAGAAVTVSPVVAITDIDSTQLASATVTTSGGSLSYGALPSGVTATAGSGSVTFTGAASVAAYQQLLQSVTLTSPSAGVATVSFTVTDDQGQASVPASTIVTVLGLPFAAAPLVVAAPVAAGTAGSAATVSPVVLITDIDSTQLASATVTTSGGSLSYGTLPSGVTATASSGSVTFTGAASVAAYQQLLQSITLTSSSAGIETVSFTVTDDQGQSSVPAPTIVTVVGLPVAAAPLIVTAPVAAGASGSPVTVSQIVVITDIDSTQLSSATVTTSGGSLSYGTLPTGVTATPNGNSVTFTGAASVAAYQQLLQSVTLTSASPAIATVSFTLTDDQGQSSVPATTIVTVLGLPVAAAPLIVTAPVAAGTSGSPLTVSPVVVITDIDSTQLSSATVSASGGSLSYGTLPSGVTATPSGNSVTFTGPASVAVYQQLLQSVTLTSSSAGIETVSLTVTDDQSQSSVPASTIVTVVGLPVAAAPLIVSAPVAAGTSGSAVTVSPVVVITDIDSTQLASATVTTSSGSLSYGGLPSGVTATAGSGSVTFTGAASVAAYQQLLQSVTLTSPSAGIVTVSFTVTDDQGQASVPASTIVTVVGLPVAAAPLVVAAPVAAGTAGSAVTVSPVVVITDIDSTQLSSATVSASGGSLSYATLPSGVTATAGSGSVTFTGAASVAAYQQLLQSVALTSPSAGIATVSFTVTDDQGQASVPAPTIVTVLGLPVAAAPLVVAVPVAAGTAGAAVTVSPVVAITDIDSTQLASATVTTSSGSLSYGALPSGVTATAGSGSVTFTGAASVAAYQQLLQSVALTSPSAGIATVSFTVTDDQGQSSVPATTIVTVLGLPVAAAPLVVAAPVAASTAGSAVTVSPVVVITDVDSAQLSSATVTTSSGSLSYGTLPAGVTATPSGNSVTFTGVASIAGYQQLLQSVTLTSASPAIATVSFTVTDDQSQSSVPASTIVTVLGLPVAAAPLVVTAPVAAGTAGGAVTVSPVVAITDIDSTQLASAAVTTSGGSLSYGTLPSGVTATPSGSSVTFSGAASVTAYQQLLQSVTLTSASPAIETVSFTVTDDQGQASVPASTIVTVVGLPVAAAPLVVTAPVAAGTAGGAVTVSQVVAITDIDSTQLASATVTTSGGSLSYGTLPSGVTATPSGNSVMFTGAASVAAYQQLLQSVTVTLADAGIATVSFTVTDDQGQASVPASTIVTVVGLPTAAAPLIVTAPVAAGTAGSAVTASPVVVITDIDSAQLASATVTTSGGSLSYGTLPSGVTATPSGNSLTFTGAASVAVYQQLLQSVTLTSASPAIETVSFTVTDDQGQASVPASTIVAVLGLPVAAAPLLVTAPVAAGTAGSAVTASPVVVITDIESAQLASATVTSSGGSLSYGTLPSGVTATPSGNSLTFTGAASVAVYQQLLQSVTLTSASPAIETVSFTVTDDQGQSSVPVSTIVTVLGLPVAAAPLLVTAPVAAGTAGGAVTVSPVVAITDIDSTQLASATVTTSSGSVSYGTLPGGVTATPSGSSVTFTGAASVAAYQQLLQSVTLTSPSAGIVTVSFTVTDDQGQASVPAPTIVTVLGLPVAAAPLIVSAPVAAGTSGSVVTVSPVVVITDIDSTQMASATVSASGGSLSYGTLPSGVTATPSGNSVMFTGAASVAAYQQLLQSVTLTSVSPAVETVSFSVTDDQGQSSVPASTIVTVVGLPTAAAPLIVAAPAAAGTSGSPVTVSPAVSITDIDSTQLASATVSASGGSLSYGTLPSGVSATVSGSSVTFTGGASIASYQQLLQSVTLTSPDGRIATVTFTVTDDLGQTSIPATTVVTVVGLPVAVPPLVVVAPVATGTAGGAVTVSPAVVITDIDSDELSSATIHIEDPAAGDTLGYGTLPSGVTATPGTGSVMFTGLASVTAYQQLLQTISLTSSSTGIKTVLFTVTDDQGGSSVPTGTAVTVLGLPPAVAPLVVTAPLASGTAGSSVVVSPVVLITDIDSPQLASATVSVAGGAGGILAWDPLPNGVTATLGANSVTFTGAAAVAAYQQLLQSVTLTVPNAAIVTVSFSVTDDQGQSSTPGTTIVTLVGLPVAAAPLVVTAPTAIGTTGTATTVSPIVAITDIDSTHMSSATVTTDTPGFTLGYGPLPQGITATSALGSVTFTGAASVDAYEQLLQSVTVTSADSGIASVSFGVTDAQGVSSLLATTIVTMLGVALAAAPLVVTAPTAAGTKGSAIAVSPAVVITDIDSTDLASATVSVSAGAGVSLNYGTLPNGVTATPSANSVTFTGVASVAAYEQLLQSVTLTSPSVGIVSVSFTVTDDQGQASVPSTTVVTVLGLPVAAAPLVVLAPVAAGTAGGPVTVSPVVSITDIDSTQLASATVTSSGGSLNYGALPIGVTATAGANSVTFTGAASVTAYEQLLQSITLTSSGAGITTVSFTVTDDQGQASVPSATVVTVFASPVAAAPLVVTAPVAAGTAGSAVTVSSVVVITDIDSTQLASATVTSSGGSLNYGTLPSGVTATPGANSVTFTGPASVAAYQQLLQSVTLTSSSTTIVTVTFTVADDQGQSSAPSATAVTVLGVPSAVAPLIVTAPTVSGTTGAATTVSPVVVITDIDSAQLSSATVSVAGGTGNSLSYGTVPAGIIASTSGGSLTFTGAASVAAYEQLLQSVTLTSSSAGIATVTFTVTDDQGQASVPATTAVTVLGVPVAIAPLVVTAPTAAGTTGSGITVSPVIVITDVDSTQLASATVSVDGSGVLGYGTLPSGVTATPGTSSVTFTGAASVAAYEQLLQSVTLTSSSAGIATVTFTVTDDQGQASVPATTAVTVLGVPVAIAPLVVTAPTAAGATGTPVTVSPVVVVTDVDSTQLASATVSVDGPGVLGYGTLPSGVTATPDANSVTFNGAASLAAYQQLLQSVTLTSSSAGIATVTFTVTDDQAQTSAPATTAVTVVGVPVAIAPLVVTAPTAAGTTGTPVTVSPAVVITDVDSTQLASATVSSTGSGVLGYGTLPSGLTATLGTNSVTFTGAASVAAYQQLLQSITLTSSAAGITTVTFTVTDDQGQASVPATTAVTVLGVPVALAPLVVTAPTASGTTGTPVTVSPAVVITDVDSTQLASATVSSTGSGVLGYGTLPSGVTATPGTNSVTFTGAASVAAYEQLLQSITLTSGTTGITTVTFMVTDDQAQTSVPATTAVTVLGVPVALAPLVVTAPTAAGSTGGAVTVSPVVVITDVDSTQLASATVSSTGSGVLGYGTLPSGVTAVPDANSLTFNGAASLAAYQQLLQSVTLTPSSAGIATVTFTVIDDQGQASAPVVTVVTVLGVPVAIAPLVVTAPTATGTTGTPVTVSPVVVITDVDSTQLASATVTLDGVGVLGYGALPSGVIATAGAGSVTFAGAASVAAYEQLLQSVTLTSSSAGIATVAFTVTDDQGQSSVPASTAVTVLGVPAAIAPLVVTTPTASGTTNSAVTVSPVVLITDVDSTQLASVTIAVDGAGVLSYGTLPSGVTATPGANSVTFTGAASVAAYQQLLQSITLISSSTGINTVTFTVTDDQGQASVPATTAVTVSGVPVAIAPLVVTAPTAAGTTGGAITVSPVVVITDVDSLQLASAVVSVTGTGVLGYGTLPSGVTATPGTSSVTFFGAASVAAYQQLLQSVTVTSSSAGITTVTFTVTDDQGQASVPATTAVTVLGVPVAIAPLVVVAPTASGSTGSAVSVSPAVVITDVDSAQLASATVSVDGSGVLGYGTLPSGVTATPGTSSVTFFGAASVAAYQQLFQSITLTSSAAGITTVTFTVTDDQGQASVPASTVVTVLGVPVAVAPLVVTAPTAAGTTGTPVTVSPVVVITDVDSTQLASATVTLDGVGVLGYGALPSGVIATAGAGSVTFAGAASVAAYEQLLQSVTLTSSSAGIATVAFTVTDDQGQSSVPASTAVTVLGVPAVIAPLVVTTPTASGTTNSAVTVSPVVLITDVDSTQLASVTIAVDGAGVLSYGTLPSGVTATPGANSVTFTGAASVAAYQQLLQSITLISSSTGINTVTFTVTDDQGQASVPATTAVTVLGVPVAIAPLVVTAPTAAGTTGGAITVSPVVVITDVDSLQLASAVVSVTGTGVLGYGALPSGVTATPGTSSVTFFGAASVAAYQQLLQSVTLTSSSAGIATVTFTVTDDQGQSSAPVVTVVTVLGVPVAVAPLVVAAPTAAGSTGSAVSVSPAVVITDVDSAQLASATVTLDGAGVLGYGTLPSGVIATAGAGSVTFTGAASVAAYQQLLQSVILTSSAAGITTVTFTVTDDQGESSVPATTAVTVLGVPVALAPLVVTAPTAAGSTGGAVTVSPAVVITDVDSTELASATVSVDGTGVLGYGTLPSGVIATAGAGSVTFTGAASVAAYQQLLQSITLASSAAGITTVTFTVTDDQGESSVPAATVVTVLGVPAAVAPLVVTAPTAAGSTGGAVTVSPVVVITDVDSTQLASATVSVDGPGVLGYGTLPSGVTATPDANSVTFTGAASVAAYQQLLQSITLTSSSTGINTVTFTVTDDQGQASVPASTAVTVLGVPVAIAPLVVTAPTTTGTTGTPVTVSPVVVITDVDSTQLASATVAVDGSGVLGYGALPSGVTATPGTNSVTFTGAASVAAYEQLLQSVTLTSSSAGIATVTFTVIDDQGQSGVPAATAVTVLGVPAAIAPLIVTTPTASGTTNSAVTVSPVVLITDVDSTQLASATVAVDGSGVLGYGTLPSGVTATPDANSVTFTGAASVAAYQQLLQSIILTSSSTGINTVTFTVTDDQGQASVPATTAVTVSGVPVAVAPLVVAAPTAAGSTGSAVTVSPAVVITDVDSTQLASATVSVDGTGVLGYGTLPSGVTAAPGANSMTFTGAASVAAYQQLLQSITLTSSATGITTVTFTVTDDQGQSSVPASTVVTVLGVPVAIAPLVVTAPTATGATGTPVAVSPVVVIADVDSTQLVSATVSVDGAGVLGYGTLPSGVTATPGANSVTFTGAASVAAYEQLLQSVTFTSSAAGITTVTFTVTDDQGQASVPATTAVTVLGVPVAIAPLVVVAPTAAGSTGSAVSVSPTVVITDVDSLQLASAVVSVTGTGVLGYGTLPSGVTATPGANSVTFTGAASVAAYEQLLQSITLTSSTTGITTVTFTVTDDQGQASVPATTAVTVVALPVAAAPVLVTSVVNVSYTAGNSAVPVDPGVIVLDADSTTMSGAVVSIVGGAAAGETLSFSAPAGITGVYSGGVLTLSGAASLASYQQALRSVTYATSSVALASVKTISFVITDSTATTSAPALVSVTVASLPVAAAPVLVTSVVNVSYTAGNSAVSVDPGVIVLDADSTTMSGAVVSIVGGAAAGETLSFSAPAGITGVYSGGVLTLSGAASLASYQQALRSVTYATSSAALASVKTISFVITDSTATTSAPALVSVTVLAAPTNVAPLVVTSVTNVSYTAGNTAVTVDPGITVLDVDSANLSGAIVTIAGSFASGDTLGFTSQAGITGSYNSATGTLTLSGTAALATYQQVLRSVTLSTGSSAPAAIKTVSFTVTDSQGASSLAGTVAVTVLAAPVDIAPLVVTSVTNVSYTAGNAGVTVDSGLTLLDLDSSNMGGATVKITGNFASGDTLSFTSQAGITGSYNSSTGTLTLSGTAALATYQQVLRSVKLSTSSSALAAIKTVSFTVSDSQGSASLPGTVTVTVLAAPINVAPLVATLVGPVYTAGNTAVSVNPLVTVTDLDSTNMTSATVAITGNFTAGDTLAFTATGGITGAYNSSTGILTLSGTATTAQYQQVLQSVTFATSGTASAAIKTITYTVTDAQGATSPSATTTVTVLANTAPVVTAPLGGAVILNQQLVSPTATIVDDSSYLQRAVITISNFQSGDNLTYTSSGGITGTYNSSTGVLTLTGLATVSDYQSVLQSLKFSKSVLNLLSTRTITMTVRDQQGLDSNTTSGIMTILL